MTGSDAASDPGGSWPLPREPLPLETSRPGVLAAAGADARGLVGSLLADAAEVYPNTSQTLEAIGVAGDIERSGRYQPLRLRLYRMDREMQRREMRALAAPPDYVAGSVHALTEGGSLLIASASGSQLGPLVSGAGQVILVIGAQKIVPDVAGCGIRRPLEDARLASLRSAERGKISHHHKAPGRSPRYRRAPRLLITAIGPARPAGRAGRTRRGARRRR